MAKVAPVVSLNVEGQDKRRRGLQNDFTDTFQANISTYMTVQN